MARLFEDSVHMFDGISGTEDFFEAWGESGFSWLSLLGANSHELLVHALSKFDPSIFRSAFFENF